MIEARQVATVRTYAELIEALRARAAELKLSRETIGKLAHLADGSANAILAPVPVPNKRLGPQSFKIIQALGLMVVLVEDEEALRRVGDLPKRAEKQVRAGVRMRTEQARRKRAHPFRGSSPWGMMMAGRSYMLTTQTYRTRSARKAARARWKKAANDNKPQAANDNKPTETQR